MTRKTYNWLAGFLGLGAGFSLTRRWLSRPAAGHPFLNGEGVLAIAHRGGKGLWPPNTLYAFERAAAMGVDILELDIHQTSDGVLVVRHDPTVDATTDGSGPIYRKTLAEIKALDAGYTWTADGSQTYPFRGQGITIPTLQEVLEAFPDIRLNIDIKPQNPAVVPSFCSMLREYDRLESVLVGSFHDAQLRRFRRECPQTATAAGVFETRLFHSLNHVRLPAAYRPPADAFQLPEFSGRTRVISPRFIQAAHTHGRQVHVWTVNEVEDMRRLIAWGVDGIITDYPDRLLELLERPVGE